MTSSELRSRLLNHGRRPLGKLIQVPLKQEGKILFADIKNDRAYSYFLIDLESKSIREGHIYERYRKKVFGAHDVPSIPLGTSL
jgi:hypothetical protein